MKGTLAELLATLPQRGRLSWIGLRTARRGPMLEPAEATLDAGAGLLGDRYAGRGGARQVTLLQAEHVAVIAALLGRGSLDPVLLRRNLLVGGVNLLALKGRRFALGETVLECTGLCHPCSRMEETLGPGGYNAVRGHGGITARVIAGGRIGLGDPLVALAPEDRR